MALLLERNKKIVFAGDSITDAGRRDVAVPFGNGFVSVVRNFLIARHPDLNLVIVNRGISGNTVRDLSARWETDVIGERPDYLAVCIGINDVWRQFDADKSTAVFPDEYQTTLRKLLTRATQSTARKLILMSPYMIELDRNQPIRKQMDVHGALMASIAKEFGATFVNLQDTWDKALRYTVPQVWSNDQFHPNGPGSALIAQAFLRAVGFQVQA